MHPTAPTARLRSKLLLSLLVLTALLALLFVLERSLHALGVGAPATFLIRDTVNGSEVYRDNPLATLPYFGPELARAPAPFSFPARKQPDVFRVFVLGGSAAAGDPDPAYSFSRLLHASLSAANPEQPVEVINASITAVNSHVLRRMTKEVARIEPDLLVLYLGHNEVVGPYGPASVFGRFTPSRLHIALRTAARASRVGQVWSGLLRRAGVADTGPGTWEGMGMFLDRKITADDPRLLPVYRHLQRNLRAMLREARAVSAHVLLCTVASDLRDCPPFASDVYPPLPAAEAVRLQALLDEGTTESLAEALTLAPTHAEAYYRLARQMETHAPDQAATLFRQARDHDALRFRADTRINEVIREAARRGDPEFVTLLDIEQAADRQPTGPWPALFLDHVHFTYEGNRWLAAHLHDTIRDLWPQRFPGAMPPARKVADAVAWNPWADWRIVLEMSRRHAKPPFTFQWDHGRRATQWSEWVARAAESAGWRADEIEAGFRNALAARPRDWFLLHALGEFLIDQKRFMEAVAPLREARSISMHRAESNERLALALVGAGLLDEAVSLLAPEADMPGAAARLGRIGLELGERSSTAAAVAALRRACDLQPGNGTLLAALGGALLIAGEPTQAKEALREALRLDPALADAHNNLGSALAGQGQLEVAITHFRDALAAVPAHLPARRNLLHALHQSAMEALRTQREETALTRLREALEIDAFFPPAMLDLAMLHATSRDPAIHSPSEALLWAGRAMQAQRRPEPRVMIVRAAALASAGLPEEAQAAALEALGQIPPDERPAWESRIHTILSTIQSRTADASPAQTQEVSPRSGR